MTLNLLIVEDTQDVAEVVEFGARMTWPGCKVMIAECGTQALEYFDHEPVDLVILDIAIPPPDGFEVCRRIRKVSQVPLIMLSVRDATVDKIRALDLGADDYLTKPFDHLELFARLRALVRRAKSVREGTVPDFVSSDFSINFTTREVRVVGEIVRLTSTEYRLLEELVRHAGTILPRDLLIDRVWGPEWVGDTRCLKVFVRRLRQKLGDDAERPRYIQTEWGIGYRFAGSTLPRR